MVNILSYLTYYIRYNFILDDSKIMRIQIKFIEKLDEYCWSFHIAILSNIRYQIKKYCLI